MQILRNHSDHFVYSVRKILSSLDLPVFEFYGRGTTENCYGNVQFTTIGIDFFDDASLVLERAVGNFHRFAYFKADLRFHLFFALFHLRKHALDFGLSHRDRLVFGSGKTDHAGGIANEIPGASDELIVFVEQMHVDDQVAWEEFPCRLAFLALLDFRDAFGRNEHLVNQVAHLLGFDTLEDVLAHLIFLSGKNVHDVPLIFACECLRHKSVQSGEKMDEVHEDEIEECDVTAEQ